jgi:photosystem II stability/assembly factor-like uncharacterized protein
LIVDPSNPNTAYGGGSYNSGFPGIIEMMNGGSSWADISVGANGTGPHTDHYAIAFDANGKLLVGTSGGIWRLDNPSPSALHWSDINGNLNTIDFNGKFSWNPSDPYSVIAGTYSNGIEAYQGDVAWTSIRPYGDAGFGTVDFNNPNFIYWIAGNNSRTILKSSDGGATWVKAVNGISQTDFSNFYEPLVMDPSNPMRLLFGTDHVYETTNQANNWTAIGTPGVNGFNPTDLVVDAMVIAKSDPNTIYVAAQGHIFVTHNDGALWTEMDIPGFTDHFADIEVNPTNSLNVFVVRDRFTSAAGGHVFETTDGGATWTDISTTLPNQPTNTFVIDPRSGALYIGNDIGVYVSTNNGKSWTRFGTGMPNSQVVDLELNQGLNILGVATRGRGFFEIQVTGMASNVVGATPATGLFGTPFNIAITALDPFRGPVPSSVATAHLSGTDGLADLLGGGPFASAQAGQTVAQAKGTDSASEGSSTPVQTTGLDGSSTAMVAGHEAASSGQAGTVLDAVFSSMGELNGGLVVDLLSLKRLPD